MIFTLNFVIFSLLSLFFAGFLFGDKSPEPFKWSRIVVFGDSLSDTKNVFDMTLGQFPPKNYFWNGRFSNGEVWIEKLSKKLGVPVMNYAHSGATTRAVFPFLFQRDLFYQINLFKEYLLANESNNKIDIRNELFVVWIGGNNYFVSDFSPEESVQDIEENIEVLIQLGGRYFLIPNLPDLSHVPLIKEREELGYLGSYSIKHNDSLLNLLEKMKRKYPGISFIHLDINKILSNKIEENNLKRTPCLSGGYSEFIEIDSQSEKKNLLNIAFNPVGAYQKILKHFFPYVLKLIFYDIRICEDPENRMFWDAIHPSAKVHCYIAEKAFSLLESYFGFKNEESLVDCREKQHKLSF